jgi:hypothetical protein
MVIEAKAYVQSTNTAINGLILRKMMVVRGYLNPRRRFTLPLST